MSASLEHQVLRDEPCPGCGALRRGIDCDCWDCPRCEGIIPGSVICGCWSCGACDRELEEHEHGFCDECLP